MKTFFSRFYMHFIEERKKNERIPVSYLFQMIKSLGILNEKQKAYGKRGETQAGQRGPRAAALFAESGLSEQKAGQSMDFAGERRVLVWGVRSEATDAPPRAQPRRGTEGGPLVKKLSHIFMDTISAALIGLW